MKEKLTLMFSLFLGTLCLSCSVSKNCLCKNSEIIIPQKEVIAFLSDSVCNTIFDASHINLYKITEKRDSVEYSPDSLVLDYVIVKKFEEISSKLTSGLQFILSDKKTYFMADYSLSAPFLPGYYIEFIKGDSKCGMLISISGGLCRLYWEEELLQEFKYTQERLLTYFLFLTTKDEILAEIMEHQNK